MANEIGSKKSIYAITIIICCFALLWPNILYPMLISSLTSIADDQGCCGVLLDKDVNGVKLVSELCKVVLNHSDSENVSLGHSPIASEVKQCRSIILNTCGIDIHVLLQDKIQLGYKYKRTLEELRTVNKSLCLKYHFDVKLELLGTPHRVKKYNISSRYQRQERMPHGTRQALSHSLKDPALRAAVKEPEIISPKLIPPIKPPVSGIKPPMGPRAHIQPQQPKSSGGIMSFLMSAYTTGIVIFFGYTVFKIFSRKQDSPPGHKQDPEFSRIVFNNNCSGNKIHEKTNGHLINDADSKLGWKQKDIIVSALNGLIQEVNRDILEREKTNDDDISQPNNNEVPVCETLLPKVRNVEKNPEHKQCQIGENQKNNDTSGHVENHVCQEKAVHKEKAIIEVVGMEFNERFENGQLWKPQNPVSNAPASPVMETKPHEIILNTSFPVNSQILISDTRTKSVTQEPSVILEGKVTLNVITPEKNDEGVSDAEEDEEIEGQDQDRHQKVITNSYRSTEPHRTKISWDKEQEDEEDDEEEQDERRDQLAQSKKELKTIDAEDNMDDDEEEEAEIDEIEVIQKVGIEKVDSEDEVDGDEYLNDVLFHKKLHYQQSNTEI